MQLQPVSTGNARKAVGQARCPAHTCPPQGTAGSSEGQHQCVGDVLAQMWLNYRRCSSARTTASRLHLFCLTPAVRHLIWCTFVDTAVSQHAHAIFGPERTVAEQIHLEVLEEGCANDITEDWVDVVAVDPLNRRIVTGCNPHQRRHWPPFAGSSTAHNCRGPLPINLRAAQALEVLADEKHSVAVEQDRNRNLFSLSYGPADKDLMQDTHHSREPARTADKVRRLSPLSERAACSQSKSDF